jgi:hypothetical protein
MGKRLSIALLALFVVMLPVVAKSVSDKTNYITPTAFDRKADVLIQGKKREYYLLEQGKQIEIKVKGPSKLKIMSRVVFDTRKDSLEYSYLFLKKDSRKTVTYSHTSHGSDKVVLAGDTSHAVGASRTKLVEIPRGEQVYTISLPKDAKNRVLFRFSLETNQFTTGTPVVPMTPAEFTTQVELISHEESAPYYRIGTGQNVALKIIGPATLKVLSRIEFDPNMTGRQKWRVQVREDGKVKGTYLLASKKSEVASYKETTTLVPSRAEAFYVEIPQGEHRYEFVLPDNHRTSLLRFLLPRTQLVKE